MRFDSNAPGKGVQMSCRLENGRLYMEWSFYVVEDLRGSEGSAARGNPENGEGDGTLGNPESCEDGRASGLPEAKQCATIHLRLADRSGGVVLECMQELWEEEPLRAVLLQPRLWNGIQDPYLYRLEVCLKDGRGQSLDCVSRQLPLCVWESREICGGVREEIFLNGESFQTKAVRYVLPRIGKYASSEAAVFSASDRQRVREDMQNLVKLGANCVYLEGDGEADREFLQVCDTLGLAVCGKTSQIKIHNVDKVPWFRSDVDCPELSEKITGNGLFSPETGAPTSLYYKYKARWSPEPFVYIVPESIQRLNSGNYTVTCYSNCNRVALYSDGILFEFQRGEESFVFWEVPAQTPCIMLSAEGEGCSQSFSVHKTFTK